MKQEDVNIEVVSIDDLIQDDHNFNKGNEQGAQLLERSFSDADTLVAVRRKDVSLDSAEGRKMAYLDIRAPFTQGGGLRRGCGKMFGHLGKILAKKSVQVWPPTN